MTNKCDIVILGLVAPISTTVSTRRYTAEVTVLIALIVVSSPLSTTINVTVMPRS